MSPHKRQLGILRANQLIFVVFCIILWRPIVAETSDNLTARMLLLLTVKKKQQQRLVFRNNSSSSSSGNNSSGSSSGTTAAARLQETTAAARLQETTAAARLQSIRTYNGNSQPNKTHQIKNYQARKIFSSPLLTQECYRSEKKKIPKNLHRHSKGTQISF
jgi:hypothetical protein